MKLPKGWRRLKSSEKTKVGDRPIFAGGDLGKLPIIASDAGYTVARSGYFGIARKGAKIR